MKKGANQSRVKLMHRRRLKAIRAVRPQRETLLAMQAVFVKEVNKFRTHMAAADQLPVLVQARAPPGHQTALGENGVPAELFPESPGSPQADNMCRKDEEREKSLRRNSCV